MADATVDASPTREFFVYMLTRDISLQDCILDLIDNCLDGARRSIENYSIDDPTDDAYAGYHCEISFTGKQFSIADNCGGIPLKIAQEYAFRFGRDPKAPKDKFGVGLYGIGMKRAIFKIGSHATVYTASKDRAFTVTIDTRNWLSNKTGDWNFPLDFEAKTKSLGTTIVVQRLNDGVDHELASRDFENTLIRIIGRDYSFFLQRGFAIKVNKHPVKPDIFEMRQGAGFNPARIRYHDEAGINVEIFAGMASVPPDDDAPTARAARDMALSGWYILCNERTILAADQTERTVWGYAGVPEWHSQYNGFKGLVFFRSRDADKLPWTTTKRDIDLGSDVYRRALRRMRELTKTWVAYTNKRKANVELAKQAERKTQPVSIFKIPKRASLTVPPSKGPTRSLMTISYQKPKAEIDRVRLALGDSSLSNREVGERTFDYYYKREADE